MNKIFIFCLFFPLSVIGQKKIKTTKQIYSSAISKIFSGKPRIIVVDKTTTNHDILEVNFTDIAIDMTRSRPHILFYPKLDTSWVEQLKKADIKKQKLGSQKIPDIEIPRFAIIMARNDSSIQLGGGSYVVVDSTPPPPQPKYWIDSRIDLSGIILLKNKAIVGIERASGSSDGEGAIYFLEKIKIKKRKKGESKRKWIVVAYLRRWVA